MIQILTEHNMIDLQNMLNPKAIKEENLAIPLRYSSANCMYMWVFVTVNTQ